MLSMEHWRKLRADALNESPSEKEGKSTFHGGVCALCTSLNESPSEKEGKSEIHVDFSPFLLCPSMKVPPKRKGNPGLVSHPVQLVQALNESPSEKEGK